MKEMGNDLGTEPVQWKEFSRPISMAVLERILKFRGEYPVRGDCLKIRRSFLNIFSRVFVFTGGYINKDFKKGQHVLVRKEVFDDRDGFYDEGDTMLLGHNDSQILRCRLEPGKVIKEWIRINFAGPAVKVVKRTRDIQR